MVYIQPNSPSEMRDQDELAALFTQHMNFNPEVQPKEEAPPPNLYSITQHYHHSARARPDMERASSEPRSTENVALETILRNHSIDPSTLTPSQISLFKIAETAQKRRLLELWSICPPNQGGDIPALAWSSSTVEHEEQLARLRYERAQQQQFVPEQHLAQTQDGRWHQDGEPYMTSGYAELMRRETDRQNNEQQQQSQRNGAYGHVGATSYSRATDPVYRASDISTEQQQMAMATQYGAFDHFRGNGDTDSMAMDVM